jgi:hypothetical protein
MAKIIKAPIIAMELKTSVPAAGKTARRYVLITFRVGSMLAPAIKKTTVLIDEDPTTAKLQLEYFEGLIASKQYGFIEGSYFTVGDKSIDPNTVLLPTFRYKLSDGTLSAPCNSMNVFVRYDSESERYLESPQKKALSIIYNEDLCVVETVSPSHADIDGGSQLPT